MKIIITGATGYIGRRLTKRLVLQGHSLFLLGRDSSALSKAFPDIENAAYEDSWEEKAKEYDCCIHLATRNSNKAGQDRDFREDNVDSLIRLAVRLTGVGVLKHVYFSSIQAGDDAASPYAKSKVEAELALRRLVEDRPDFRLAILRPAFVHAWPMRGRLAILNPLPAPLRMLIFNCLAALRPTVRYEKLEATVLALLEENIWQEEPVFVSNQQLGNPVYHFLFRGIDFIFVAAILLCFGWFFPFLYLIIRLDSHGPAIFSQKRVGREGAVFLCHKFRTMQEGTKEAATHEIGQNSVTRVGRLLRIYKIDELPQIWNILTGEMSLVGPRPCLPSQHELIEERKRAGVLSVRPGITGYAQIRNIDMSNPKRLASADACYLHFRSIPMDIRIILRTALGGGMEDKVSS